MLDAMIESSEALGVRFEGAPEAEAEIRATIGEQFRLLNRFDLALECNTCGERWSPSHRTDGRLVEGYWRCPNRCNW